MKKIALVLFAVIILLPNFLIAQTRPPQDVRRVTVTSKYEIVDGKKTGQFKPIKQDIYDSLGQLHTIVYFNYLTGKVDGFIWNTFQNGLLVNTEEYSNDKLIQRTEYKYNSKSLIDNELINKVADNDTLQYLTLKYTYNSQGKPVKINALSGKGKKAYTILSVFNSNGTEISRKARVKKGFMPKDSILLIKNKPIYNSQGKVESEQLLIKYSSGITKNVIYKYTYDDKGNLTQKTESDNSGNLLFTYSYKYNSKGKVIEVEKIDSANKMVESFAYRNEIYPKSNVTQREIEY